MVLLDLLYFKDTSIHKYIDCINKRLFYNKQITSILTITKLHFKGICKLCNDSKFGVNFRISFDKKFSS